MKGRFYPSEMPTAIAAGIDYFDEDPAEINDGSCGEFAHWVANRVEGADVVYLEDVVEEGDLEGLPYHVWIKCAGKFYDSETPNGVSAWQDLPTLRRHFQS